MKQKATILFFIAIFCSIEQNLLGAEKKNQTAEKSTHQEDKIFLRCRVNLQKLFGFSVQYNELRDELKNGLKQASDERKKGLKQASFDLDDFFRKKAEYLDTKYPGSGPYKIRFSDLIKIKPDVDLIEKRISKLIMANYGVSRETDAQLRFIMRPKIQKFVVDHPNEEMLSEMCFQLIEHALEKYHDMRAPKKSNEPILISLWDPNSEDIQQKQNNTTVSSHQTNETVSDLISLASAKSMLRVSLRKVLGNIAELNKIHERIYDRLWKASENQKTEGFLKKEDCEIIFDQAILDEINRLDKSTYRQGSPFNKLAFTNLPSLEPKVQEIENRVNELVRIPGFPVALQNEIKKIIRPELQYLVTQFEAISDEMLNHLILQCARKREWQPQPRSRQSFISNFAPAVRKYVKKNVYKIIFQQTKDELIKDIMADIEEIEKVLCNEPDFGKELLLNPLADVLELSTGDLLLMNHLRLSELIKSKNMEVLEKLKEKSKKVKDILSKNSVFQTATKT